MKVLVHVNVSVYCWRFIKCWMFRETKNWPLNCLISVALPYNTFVFSGTTSRYLPWVWNCSDNSYPKILKISSLDEWYHYVSACRWISYLVSNLLGTEYFLSITVWNEMCFLQLNGLLCVRFWKRPLLFCGFQWLVPRSI